MKITPLDISQKQFRRVMRGLDAEEVEAFLALVASAFEELVKEAMGLKDEARRKDDEIASLRSRERSLQETMITAQKACEDIREAARKEAEITISEAELQAEKIVQGAHTRFLRIVEDINELKRQRVEFESSLRSIIDGHLKLLSAFRDPQRQDAPIEFVPKKRAADE